MAHFFVPIPASCICVGYFAIQFLLPFPSFCYCSVHHPEAEHLFCQKKELVLTKLGERFAKIVIFTLMKMLTKCCQMMFVKQKIDYSHVFGAYTEVDLLNNMN